MVKGIYETDRLSPEAGFALYSGFAGTETLRGQRDWKANPTVLSGAGYPYSTDALLCAAEGIVIDGFTIRNARTPVTVTTSGTATLLNNTITGNRQDGVYVDGDAHLVNNIIAFNTRNGADKESAGRIAAFHHNEVVGNAGGDDSNYTPGAGNLSIDPLSQDRLYGNFPLKTGSPCIDAGDNGAVQAGDLNGKARIFGSFVDMGACEYTGGKAPYTYGETARCLAIASGLRSGTPDDLARLNVESSTARLDMRDAIRIARKAAGLEPNP